MAWTGAKSIFPTTGLGHVLADTQDSDVIPTVRARIEMQTCKELICSEARLRTPEASISSIPEVHWLTVPHRHRYPALAQLRAYTTHSTWPAACLFQAQHVFCYFHENTSYLVRRLHRALSCSRIGFSKPHSVRGQPWLISTPVAVAVAVTVVATAMVHEAVALLIVPARVHCAVHPSVSCFCIFH